MKELRDKIISMAHIRFLNNGIKWLNLDYIANDCSISRKTLNHYFKRQELIETVISYRLEAYHQSLMAIEMDQLEPLGEMERLLDFIEALSSEFSAILLRDLRRYYNEYWLWVDGFLTGPMRNAFIANLRKGVRLGIYRKTIDVEPLTDIYFMSAINFIENESDRLRPGSRKNRLRALNDNFLAGLIDHK